MLYYKETVFSIIDSDIMQEDALFKEANISARNEEYDPDFFYVRVRSISAGEYFGSNRNADYFQETELIKSHHTFLDAHVFKNHENKDVANAIGSIISSTWNSVMKCVELVIKIDRQLAPTIVRGFEKGYTTDVSMGCRVSHTVCSICGNKAKTRAEFCEHVKGMRNKVNPDGTKIFEYNYGPRFHDLSIVLNGADRTAKVLQIYDENNINTINKVASSTIPHGEVTSFEDAILKTAGTLSTRASDDFSIMSLSSANTVDLTKLAEFKKEITDKLYVISLLRRMNSNGTFTDEVLDDIIRIGKEAHMPMYLGIDKEARRAPSTLGKDLRNIAIGTTAIAGATNYYQGKRLRGEHTSNTENFIADNPGILPLMFVLGGYPAYKKLKSQAPLYKDKMTPYKTKFTDLFTKEASELLETRPLVNTVDLLDKDTTVELLQNKYNMSKDKQNIAKLALVLYQAGREDLVDTLKSDYNITDEDLNNVLSAGLLVAEDDLNKEASFAYGMLVANLFNPSKIPTGLASSSVLAGSVVDGYLISKTMSPGKAADKVEKIREVVPNNIT